MNYYKKISRERMIKEPITKDLLEHLYLELNRSPEDIAKLYNIKTVEIYRKLRDFDLLNISHKKLLDEFF